VGRTTLGTLRAGSKVNLERAVRAGDRLGGHLVLGHVDDKVTVAAVRRETEFCTLRAALPAALAGEVAEKGSVTLDGVSLTVARLGDGWFEVALVPATLGATTLRELRAGHQANLETDVLAKYVRRALGRDRQGIETLWQELTGAVG
jgi:riboflavin synthase